MSPMFGARLLPDDTYVAIKRTDVEYTVILSDEDGQWFDTGHSFARGTGLVEDTGAWIAAHKARDAILDQFQKIRDKHIRQGEVN